MINDCGLLYVHKNKVYKKPKIKKFTKKQRVTQKGNQSQKLKISLTKSNLTLKNREHSGNEYFRRIRKST